MSKNFARVIPIHLLYTDIPLSFMAAYLAFTYPFGVPSIAQLHPHLNAGNVTEPGLWALCNAAIVAGQPFDSQAARKAEFHGHESGLLRYLESSCSFVPLIAIIWFYREP